ncbi:DHA2 family efflux MFS transporter permease subunit [Methylobacterium sp. P1-11]|uniref:DHA2 family efflux MFS transporter permease subunit n=1 Tax=Methylobacterium sp. P1-11 TaxID=2024616 RepID=UPI0018D95D75|nr:DHA2 family efflux MFS transporter permease subunit [Methylobacterium sp. P1-11]
MHPGELAASSVDPIAEGESPVPAEARMARPNQVLAIVCVGIVLANLDLFIVNVALPDIARDFRGADLQQLSWILNAYAIVYAALLVFFGRLAERYRRDASFLLGVALFTLSSAACAAATSVGMLVAFRIVQAAGAALMTPTSLGLLLATFPAERRGHAVRTWTAIGGFAAALGPVIGGLLVAWSWRWIFIVNVPIGVFALVIGIRKLPSIPGHAVRRPDAWGALLVTLGVGLLTFGIMSSAEWGWASGATILTLASAVVLLALFVVDCLRSDNPLVDPKLFHIVPFTGAALILAPYSVAFGAMLLSIALWLQEGWGWSGLKAGLTIAPGPFLVPVTSLLVAGPLIARIGQAAVVALGIVLFAGGLIWWALVPGLDPNLPAALVGMTFLGVGVGLAFPTLMGAGTAALPPSSFATGSGVLNMARQTALALGVAIFVAVTGTPGTPAARLVAFEHTWWLMAGLTLACLLPLALLRSPRSHAR